ncbi:hypothetical protein [Bdellovibrio bacteriovorus]|uniref:Uncharacterized protein n=1 Tax=Bdellovibrio bacteriovorus str. Tiberius TaxID=1069642 RepID=K7YUB1_BDEBC|nr:hypothetical protein [Bdellovibrio bacteriovorus]AFY01233.1 hypothetical protein Bdt_1538 [Bdellovibrio bacteriovorus str. Tiberius]
MRFLSLILLFALNAQAATLVTETVGQVSDYVVTSREVQISLVIGQVLEPSSKLPKNTLPEVRPGQPEFSGAVTQVLLEQVVALEAENFNVASVPDVEVDAAVVKVEKAVAGRAYWAGIEPTSAEVRRFTTRKLIAKSFLKFKTNSMTGIITDQEAQAYYEKNRAKFGSSPFEDFRDNIKAFLAQQQLEERIRSWFEVIQRKYKVRNFVAE